MHPFAVYLAAVLVPFVSARCGTPDLPRNQLLQAENHFQNFFSDNIQSFAAAEPAPIVVPTWFHIVTNGAEGDVSDVAIKAQIDVLNADYAGNVKFVHAGTTRQSNVKWFVAGPSGAGVADYQNMKSTLRRGGPETLNIYTNKPQSPAGLLGVATFPSSYASSPKLDGALVHYASLPGGTLQSFNLGRTATHEVGHWLAEATAASGCPTNRDTCTGANFPGADPVTNFMDYSADSCFISFTPGQYARIQAQYQLYRNTGVVVPTTTSTTTTKAAATTTKPAVTSSTTTTTVKATTTTTTTNKPVTTAATGNGPVVGQSCPAHGTSQCYNKTIGNLCNDVTEKQPNKGKRALGMKVDNSASSAGLHQAANEEANEKLEDTAEDQIAQQVASFTNRIKAMSQGSSDRIPDDVLG
ncbi:UNVERIFIED_CONTAM: hypothetical protein HDU68_003837, partial [Siphonaria sp. JEL0065]